MNKLLDFSTNKVEMITLNELKRTAKELNVNDEPIMGISHVDFFEQALEKIDKSGLKYTIEPLYAGQNVDKYRPGVSILKKSQEEYGVGSLESHIIRRVIGRIQIEDFSNDEHNTAIALNFHQNGLQIGYGQNVRVCQNMTIMGASNIVSTYSANFKERVSIEMLMMKLDEFLRNHETLRRQDVIDITALQNREVKHEEALRLIGKMTEIRVRRDFYNAKGCPPLNQGQISEFAKEYVNQYDRLIEGKDLNAFDLYNIGTLQHKVGKTNIPDILDANLALSQLFKQEFIAV